MSNPEKQSTTDGPAETGGMLRDEEQAKRMDAGPHTTCKGDQMKPDPDHYLTQPMDNQEAVHNREIAALKCHLVKLHVVAWKCLSELGDYPCRRDEMTEREGGIAAMVESLVATMQYIEKATLDEAPRGLPLLEACAKAISDFDTITPRPLTAEDQARAVLDFLANTEVSRGA